MRVFLCSIVFSLFALAAENSQRVQFLKETIVEVASHYQGLGDPDFKIQNELEFLVNELIVLTNPVPVKDRLPLVFGTWKQVWGPYDYRGDKRGVDPSLEAKEIYQIVSPDGYYYNVSPSYRNGDRSKIKINFLKGFYKLSSKDPNGLDVRFDKFIAIPYRPQGAIYDFVPAAEKNKLPNQVTVLPRIFVKLFFEGGTLQEVYTDKDIRILYGSNSKNFAKRYLYIMIRVPILL